MRFPRKFSYFLKMSLCKIFYSFRVWASQPSWHQTLDVLASGFHLSLSALKLWGLTHKFPVDSCNALRLQCIVKGTHSEQILSMQTLLFSFSNWCVIFHKLRILQIFQRWFGFDASESLITKACGEMTRRGEYVCWGLNEIYMSIPSPLCYDTAIAGK